MRYRLTLLASGGLEDGSSNGGGGLHPLPYFL